MAEEYLIGRGVVVKVNGQSDSPGILVDGWPHRIGDGLVTVDSCDPIVKDVYNALNAVDGFHVLYRFGKDFGQITVSGTIYMGCTTNGAPKQMSIIKDVQDAFDKFRLSKKGTVTKVSVAGGGKWDVAFTQLALQGGEAEFQRMRYYLIGIIVPAESTGS